MSIYTFKTWWQQRCETAKCLALREELRLLLDDRTGNEEAIAKKLIDLEKSIHPGQSESWYIDRVIYNLSRTL